MKNIITIFLIICSLFVISCLPSTVTPEGEKDWERYERGQTP